MNQVELREAINRFALASFGEEAKLAWVAVTPGNGFTAGLHSRSSVVSLGSPERLTPQRRESLLRELVDLWTAETRCTVDEVVAVISDPIAPREV